MPNLRRLLMIGHFEIIFFFYLEEIGYIVEVRVEEYLACFWNTTAALSTC